MKDSLPGAEDTKKYSIVMVPLLRLMTYLEKQDYYIKINNSDFCDVNEWCMSTSVIVAGIRKIFIYEVRRAIS